MGGDGGGQVSIGGGERPDGGGSPPIPPHVGKPWTGFNAQIFIGHSQWGACLLGDLKNHNTVHKVGTT